MKRIYLTSEDGKDFKAKLGSDIGTLYDIDIPTSSLKYFFDETILRICMDDITIEIKDDSSVVFKRGYTEFAATKLLRPFEDFRSYVLLLAINKLMPFIKITDSDIKNISIVPEKLMGINTKLLK